MSFNPVIRATDPYAGNPLYKEVARKPEKYGEDNVVQITYRHNEATFIKVARLAGLVLLAVCTLGQAFWLQKVRLECSSVIHSFSNSTIYLNTVKEPSAIDIAIKEIVGSILILAIEKIEMNLKSLAALRKVLELAPSYSVSADGIEQAYTPEQLISRREALLTHLAEVAPKDLLGYYEIGFVFTRGEETCEQFIRTDLYGFFRYHTEFVPILRHDIETILREKAPFCLCGYSMLSSYNSPDKSSGTMQDGKPYPNLVGVAPLGSQFIVKRCERYSS